MKYSLKCKIFGKFYLSACKKELSKRFPNSNMSEKIIDEYKNIVLRAKDIGNSKLFSAYMMGAYFIALNGNTDLSPEDNYELFKNGLYQSKILHILLGNADSYLNAKKMKSRKEWERISHERKYENDWVVDILDKTDTYELGYNYHECGICKLCRDEKCFELAHYLCRLDFVMADIMGMELKRTKTIAEGGDSCDFRYSRKSSHYE